MDAFIEIHTTRSVRYALNNEQVGSLVDICVAARAARALQPSQTGRKSQPPFGQSNSISLCLREFPQQRSAMASNAKKGNSETSPLSVSGQLLQLRLLIGQIVSAVLSL